jgi:hypothetical protein
MTCIYHKNGVPTRLTIQPPVNLQAESTGLFLVDGEIGQISLEKTDAKTASPSFIVSSQITSVSRKRPDNNGPFGPKGS